MFQKQPNKVRLMQAGRAGGGQEDVFQFYSGMIFAKVGVTSTNSFFVMEMLFQQYLQIPVLGVRGMGGMGGMGLKKALLSLSRWWKRGLTCYLLSVV